MSEIAFIPHQQYSPDSDPLIASQRFYEILSKRRSVRYFSDKPVPEQLIKNLILAAGTAPSGSNKQPWRFVAVKDPAIKKEIRIAAEEEEREFYKHRANENWLKDLKAIGTDENKPFLEIAPWLIVIFKLMKDDNEQNASDQVYYASESVGIATGMFLTAAHFAGLATLTHTPSPMKFLARILNRPDYERPFLLVPVGYPADDCVVPDISRKPLEEIMVVDRG